MVKQDHFVATVLLSLLVFSNVVIHAEADWVQLPENELVALQDLLGAWNESTPDIQSNLPGWVPFDPANSSIDPCYYETWQGVFCFIEESNITGLYHASVVSITVSYASVVGTLPSSLWNFFSIISLTLTGNPELSGPIPSVPAAWLQNNSIKGWTLRSLNLQGNAFFGSIPKSLFTYYNRLEDLDLSNNLLEGPLPGSLGNCSYLRTLKLANNSLTGNVSGNITSSWTNLVTADFSSNRFNGTMPNLTSAISLHTLNVSNNNFNGPLVLSVLSPSANKSLAILDLSNNSFFGPIPDLGLWQELQSLNLSFNPFASGAFPPWLSSLHNLETLGLSNTSLTGELDLSMLCNITGLSTVELDGNFINGTLNIDSLTCNRTVRALRTVRLKYNDIFHVQYSSPDVAHLLTTFELTGNPYCRSETSDIDLQRCLCGLGCYDTKAAIRTNVKIIIGSAIGGSIGVVMTIIAAILFWKNGRDRRYLLLAVHEKFAEYEMKPTLFAYGELEKATRNFHPDMKVGEGAFGAVYKGKLADGTEVAVKQLLTKAQQNMDDFLNEVVLLTTVKHRNLVKLKGCCLRGDRRLLVYEYLPNYDLAETLFEQKGNQMVTWPARFNICLGVAQGLHYLHTGVEPRILHRDIKASNVLLDHNFHPKIADFGLAMLFPNEESHVTILQVAGTKGYMAPEYATQGQLSDKVDVFSFGVLVLEVVSGRKNISFDAPSDKTYLIEWAWRLNEEGRLMDLVDPMMSIQSDEEAVVQRVIITALACLQTASERRPTMAQVVGMLQGDIEIGESVRGRINEKVYQSYRTMLGLHNSTATPLMTVDEENLTLVVPVDEERHALHLGGSSSSGMPGRRAFELSTVRGR